VRVLRAALTSLLLLAGVGPLHAAQFGPNFYGIDGRRFVTSGPTLKALAIAYARYAPASAISPEVLLSKEAVDIVRHDDGSYTITFLGAGRSVGVSADMVAPAKVTLTNPHLAGPQPEVTLFGPDAAALIIAAREWNRLSELLIKPEPLLYDEKSRNIANYDVSVGMQYLGGKNYYVVGLVPRYFPCLPRCTVAASDWQIRIDAQTFQPGHFQSVG